MTLAGAIPDVASRSAARERAHAFVRRTSPRSGAKGCMVEPVDLAVTVAVDEGGHAHVGGLKRCASPWSCPLCSPRIRQRRADEVNALVGAVEARGGSAWLVTATIPHGPDDPLSGLLDGLQRAWSRLWSGRASQALRAAYGIVGSVRAVEVTYGVESGWGPHLHAVLVADRRLDDDEHVALWLALLGRWGDACVAAGLRRPNAFGIDVQRVNDPRAVADYVVDAGGWSIGAEVAAGPVKLGRSRSRWSPFALLLAASCWGDAQAAAVWQEYERATTGRRAIVVTRGLFARYGLDQAADDEAAQVAVVDPVAVVEVAHADWLALVELRRAWVWLRLVEEWHAAGQHGPPPDVVAALEVDVGPMVWRE